MYDDHEHDLDQPPEGSIVTPIFLGCGAMGLGCLFSGGLIAIALYFFAPGLWDLISHLEDPFVSEAFALVQEDPDVIAAIGEPMEYDLNDLDIIEDDDEEIVVGDVVTLITRFDLSGPLGTAEVTVESLQEFNLNGAQELRSVIVTLEDGTILRVFPADGDVPPPPQQLAPPDVPPGTDGAADDPVNPKEVPSP